MSGRNLRHEAWMAAGYPSEDFVSWLAQQWAAYDREHGITASDRVFSLVTYSQHQQAFTTWLLERFPLAVEVPS